MVVPAGYRQGNRGGMVPARYRQGNRGREVRSVARLAGIRAARSPAAATSDLRLTPAHTLSTKCYRSPNATLVLLKITCS